MIATPPNLILHAALALWSFFSQLRVELRCSHKSSVKQIQLSEYFKTHSQMHEKCSRRDKSSTVKSISYETEVTSANQKQKLLLKFNIILVIISILLIQWFSRDLYIFYNVYVLYYYYQYKCSSFILPYQFELKKLGASPCSPVPPCVQMRKGRHYDYYCYRHYYQC